MTFIRRILAFSMLCVLLLTLSGCGKGIDGSWQVTGGNALTAIYTLENSSLDASGAKIVFTFGEGGTFFLELSRNGDTSQLTGTWEADGDTVAIVINDSPLKCSYTIEKDVLTLYFAYQGMGASFVLKRI